MNPSKCMDGLLDGLSLVEHNQFMQFTFTQVLYLSPIFKWPVAHNLETDTIITGRHGGAVVRNVASRLLGPVQGLSGRQWMHIIITFYTMPLIWQENML